MCSTHIGLLIYPVIHVGPAPGSPIFQYLAVTVYAATGSHKMKHQRKLTDLSAYLDDVISDDCGSDCRVC